MSLKRWISVFTLFACLTAGAAAGFNAAIDPFGVFGDRLLNWHEYNMTNNPRVSKIAYLDEHHEQYDSYIIGSSKTSSFPVNSLNKYYKAKFYNLLMYGGDLYDIEKTADYVIKKYKPKHLIINIGLEETTGYNRPRDLKNDLHFQVDAEPYWLFYAKYLFMNPQYSYAKATEVFGKSYLPGNNTSFVPETGSFNKVVRDSGAIPAMSRYLNENPSFTEESPAVKMTETDKAIEGIARIKQSCEANNINFVLVTSPAYYGELMMYNMQDLQSFWNKLAGVTDFWDFSGYTSISYDPRYFYDKYHFRNSVGEMAVARMFNEKKVYIPEDFGRLITRDNVQDYAVQAFSPKPQILDNSVVVPILIYHHFGAEVNEDTTTPKKFEKDMQGLKTHGYTSVTYKDLVHYVYQGKELPERPVVISIDDGYYSNYEYAFPVLKRLNMKTVISVIGCSVGKDTYKDTSIKIIPHFDYNQAKEMYQTGLVDIQSHSYDMHNVRDYDSTYREGVCQRKGEGEQEYISTFISDFAKSKSEIEAGVGNKVFVYTYPFGKHTELSDAILKEMNVLVTVTTESGANTIVKGLPQSLYSLKRISPSYDGNIIEEIEREMDEQKGNDKEFFKLQP